MIKFGIIGFGRIGRRHAEHASKFGQLVSVCDINESNLKDASENYDCSTYIDINKFLTENKNRIDVVAICTPNGLHAEHSILSSNNGFNVLCEKPMALNSFDCGEMIKASEANNKRLFIVKQNRFNPPISALKNAIDDNKLGKILSLQLNCFWNRNDNYFLNSWKGTKKLDGGTLFTQFSHFIDLLYWINGDIIEVNAYTNNYIHSHNIEFEDSGVVILKFKNESIGTVNFNINSFEKNMEGSLTIFGENGTVKVGGQYLNELEYSSISNFNFGNLLREIKLITMVLILVQCQIII